MGPKRAHASNAPRRGGRGGAANTQPATSHQGPTTQTQQTALPPVAPAPAAPAGPRVLPVSRRLGYAPGNRRQPFNRPHTAEEQNQRLEALRNQLQYPWALHEDTLLFHLMREGWDVNRAARSFGDANGNPNLLPNQPPNPHRRGRTLESSRRRFVHDVGLGLRHVDRRAAEEAENRNRRPPQQTTTNNVNLIPILQANRWNPQAIEAELSQRRGTYSDVVETVARLRAPPTSIAQRDERLAWFISATGTESWYSAMVFLESHSWDVARAVDAWLRGGDIPHIDPPFTVDTRGRVITEVADGGMRGFEHEEIDVIPEKNKSWKPTPDEDEKPDRRFRDRGSVASLHDNDGGEQSRDFGYTPGDHQRSAYVIEEDRRPARVNCPDPTKLRIESIQGQRYKIKWSSGKADDNGLDKAFKWNDEGRLDKSKEFEFDWAVPEHVTSLNRWRQEYFRRCTGELAREETIPFNKYEHDWLREQEAMRIEEKFYELADQDQADPGVTDTNAMADARNAFGAETHQLPFPYTQAENRDLTQRFNQTFENKITYQKVVDLGNGRQTRSLKIFDRRRPRRSEEMIRTQRTRIATLCRHFLVKANNPHGGRRDVDAMSSDTDSDFEKQGVVQKRGRSESSEEVVSPSKGAQKRGRSESSEEVVGPSKRVRVDWGGVGKKPKEEEEDEDDEDVEDVPYSGDWFFREEDEEDEDLYGPG